MNMTLSNKLPAILDSVYAAANDLTTDKWGNVYDQISDFLSSGHGGFDLYAPSTEQYVSTSYSLSEEQLKPYFEYFQHCNPFRDTVRSMKQGDSFSRLSSMADDEFLKTEIYQDYFRKLDIFHIDRWVLLSEGGISASVFFSRPRSMRPFSDEEHESIRLITQHLKRAFSTYFRLAKIQDENLSYLDATDRLTQAFVLVNKECKISIANRSAEEAFASKNGLMVGKNGVLSATDPADNSRLRKAVESVFERKINVESTMGGSITVQRQDGARPLQLLITPYGEDHSPSFGSRRMAMIFVHDPEKTIVPDENILMQLFGLTRTEAKCSSYLASGKSMAELCDSMCITLNTARTHLKHIFSKTETNRQSELVSLILSGPATIRIENVVE